MAPFRMGNLVVDGSELAAVLDWEAAHIGSAAEDAAWFCLRAWRFGATAENGAGGLGGIGEFLAEDEQARAATITAASFRWWSVMAALRWGGVICRYQAAHRHLFSGQKRSVELAAIGRRVSKTDSHKLQLVDAEAVPSA